MNDDILHKINEFFEHYRLVKYPKNQILLFPGDIVDKVYYIVSGRVSQYDISYRGDDIIVNTLQPPSFFPMAMAVEGAPTLFFYRTESVVEMRVAPIADVLAFLHDTPDATLILLKNMYSSIETLLQKIVILMAGSARSKLIYELITEYHRFGTDANAASQLSLSEVSLAARTGLSRETVNRELKHLKDQHLVEVKRSKLSIIDIVRLEATLRSQPLG